MSAAENNRSTADLWAGAFVSAAVRSKLSPSLGLWLGADAGFTLADAEYAPEEAVMLSTGSAFVTTELGFEVHLD